MLIKKISVLLLVLAIILLAIPSCTGKTISAIGLDLSLSRPPRPGETAELDFSISIRMYTGTMDSTKAKSLENARAWVEFSYANHKGSYLEARNAVTIPLDEVLVSGELYWEGNAIENRFIELGGTVQLPREGVWKITGYFSGEDWGLPFKRDITVAVTENVAEFLDYSNFKYWLVGIFNYLTGRSLHYLSYYPYGHGPQRTLDEGDPTVLTLDIPKIPKAGEEVIVSCRIDSLIDAPDYYAEIKFTKRLNDGSRVNIPGDSLLVDGNLNWTGDLQKGEPVEFSATVIFPENGDWRIQARGRSREDMGTWITNTIEMHIQGNKGYYGWK